MRSLVLVDDTPHLLEELRDIFEMEGFTAITCLSAADALREICQHTPDVIITDINMPGMSGFEFLDRLKEDPAYQHIPVMVLSARADPQSAQEAFDRNADAYLTKPCDIGELLDHVNKLCGNEAH